MKKYILYGMLVIALCGPNIVQADAPHELTGFVLGGRMNEFKDQVEMDTVIPTRYLESLKEVEAAEIKDLKPDWSPTVPASNRRGSSGLNSSMPIIL